MKCKKCGAQLPDDALQCDVCGAPIEEEMSDFDEETKIIDVDELRQRSGEAQKSKESDFNEEQSAPEDEEELDENAKVRRAQMQKMQEEKQRQLSEIEKRRDAKKKRQRRTKALIIGILCALLVGGAGIGAYYVAKNVTDGTTELSATPTPAALPTISPAATALPTVTPAASPLASQAPAGQSANANGSGAGESTASSQRTASSTSSQRTEASQGSSASQNSSQSKSGANSSSAKSKASQSQTPSSGLVSDPINARSVKGGQVIYNEGTGRYLMTFTMDGKVYYANVSEGSTTEQIKDKTFTIDAAATNESYGGNTVYEISSMKNATQNTNQTNNQTAKAQSSASKSGDYIFADTDKRLLTANDIKGMSKYDLALARNEIFARHGRKFQMKEYANYFAKKSWYKINPNYNYSDDFANLNSTEIKNVKFIMQAEK